MATVNISVGTTWTLVVPTAATWFIASSDSPSIVEYASGANDSTAPAVAIGRRLNSGEGMTRSLLQEGPLYARVASQNSSLKAVIVVDADVVPS